jgi:hypothetical protein
MEPMNAPEIMIGVATGLLVNECCEISPWLARRIVRWATRLRYRDEPERLALRLDELDSLTRQPVGKLIQLIVALPFATSAVTYRLRARARRAQWSINQLRLEYLTASALMGTAISVGCLVPLAGVMAAVEAMAAIVLLARRSDRRLAGWLEVMVAAKIITPDEGRLLGQYTRCWWRRSAPCRRWRPEVKEAAFRLGIALVSLAHGADRFDPCVPPRTWPRSPSRRVRNVVRARRRLAAAMDDHPEAP